MLQFQTEYQNIDALLDGVHLVRYVYKRDSDTNIKPKFYKVGGWIYKIGSKEENDLKGIKCIYSGANQNANLSSIKDS